MAKKKPTAKSSQKSKVEKVQASRISSKKAKKKNAPTDGFGPKEIADVRKAIRLVWSRSFSRRLVVQRCTGEKGFLFCERCGERTPKIEVNHIETVGDLDDGFLRRLFCSSYEMEGLCKSCHSEVTKEERKAATAKKKEAKKYGFTPEEAAMPYISVADLEKAKSIRGYEAEIIHLDDPRVDKIIQNAYELMDAKSFQGGVKVIESEDRDYVEVSLSDLI